MTPVSPPESPQALPIQPLVQKIASTPIQAMRWLAVASLVALIVLGVGWELQWAPVKPGGSMLALKVLPLCFAVAGLLKQRMYTYRWLSLLVWLYAAEGAVRGYGDRPPGNWLGWLEVALCLLLFTACTLHIRFRQASAKSNPGP